MIRCYSSFHLRYHVVSSMIDTSSRRLHSQEYWIEMEAGVFSPKGLSNQSAKAIATS